MRPSIALRPTSALVMPGAPIQLFDGVPTPPSPNTLTLAPRGPEPDAN